MFGGLFPSACAHVGSWVPVCWLIGCFILTVVVGAVLVSVAAVVVMVATVEVVVVVTGDSGGNSVAVIVMVLGHGSFGPRQFRVFCLMIVQGTAYSGGLSEFLRGIHG